MKNQITENINISSFEKLIIPDEIKDRPPLQEGTFQEETFRIVHNNHQVILAICPHIFFDVDPYEHHANDQLTKVAS